MRIIRMIKLEQGLHPDSAEEYIIFLNGEVTGAVSVKGSEIRKMVFAKGTDERYVLDKILRMINRKASELHMIKYFIYSDTRHTQYFEKLGFVKRKRFFDEEKNKYFKMFKIV